MGLLRVSSGETDHSGGAERQRESDSVSSSHGSAERKLRSAESIRPLKREMREAGRDVVRLRCVLEYLGPFRINIV